MGVMVEVETAVSQKPDIKEGNGEKDIVPADAAYARQLAAAQKYEPVDYADADAARELEAHDNLILAATFTTIDASKGRLSE